MQQDEHLLLLCRNLIEAKLGWGESKGWTNGDFEMLSEKILSETGVNLSTSTLKRLWGKVKYESVPQVATLNALARFAGYESFRDFELAHNKIAEKDSAPNTNGEEVLKEDSFDKVPTPLHEVTPKIIPPKKRHISSSGIWSIGLLMGICLSLLLAFSLTVNQKKDTTVNPALYSFSSRPVGEGIPNSVVFTLDAREAKSDCVYIQQSWDPRLRFKVKKDQRQATSIYYHPGFYKAKLLVDNQVVKEHDLYIKTKGWLPIVEQEPVPVYFTREESIKGGMLSLSAEILESSNIALQPVVPWVRFYYVQELGSLSSHNFTLETGLKNTYAKGSGACQESSLMVLCENTVLDVPLAIPGCTAALNAFFAGKELNGDQMDLSPLGVDFSNWVKLRLEAKNKVVQVFINDKLALQTSFSMDAGKIIGIVYRFQGTGAVDYLHLFDEQGKIVYKEEF